MGGGKTLVKLTIYTIILIPILSYTVNATKKKTTTSTKRAATINNNSSKKKVTVSSVRKTALSSPKRQVTRIYNRNPSNIITATNDNTSCPVCPDCDTSSLKKQISSLNNENANLKSEIKNLKAQQEEVTKEPVLSEAEEKTRLTKLRIEKVPGTTDDYKCIEGWTNNWDEDFLDRKKGHIFEDPVITYSKIMDKYGVIKDEAERNKYGKFKKGCPITNQVASIKINSKNIYTFYLYKYDEKLKLYIYDNKYFTPKLVPFLYNQSYTGLNLAYFNYNTEEEINNWGGYVPILGYALIIDDKNFLGDFDESVYDKEDEKWKPKYILYKREGTARNLIYTEQSLQEDFADKKVLNKNSSYSIDEGIIKGGDRILAKNDYYHGLINPFIFPFWDYNPNF